MARLLVRDGSLHRVIEAAQAAPSFHNARPWHFAVDDGGTLQVRANLDRALWVADPRARSLYLSCGAALFNIRAAIRMNGFNPLVWPLPQPTFSPTVLAVVRAEPGRPPSLAEREMFHAIWRRHTDRRPSGPDPLPGAVRTALEDAAGFEFASLRLLSPPDTATVLTLASQAGAELAGDAEHQAEPQDWAGVVPTIPRQSGDYEQFPLVAVLTTERDEPADWLRAGQAMQRVLLTATVHGLAASFLYQPIELTDMRGDLALAWPWPEHPQMIFRLGYGRGAAASPRRPVDEALSRTTAAEQPG